MGTRAPGFAGPAWARFRANRRGWFSLWIFAALYLLSLCAPLVSREPGGAFPVPPLFKSGPHTVWGPEEIEPWLRPVRGSGGRWPVAAAEYAPGPGGAPELVRSWGDADRFAAALSGPVPEAVRGAMAARWRGEEAPAFEMAAGGVSWRLAPFPARPRLAVAGGDSAAPPVARVYLRRETWRTDAPEAEGPEGGAPALEPAVFPFRPVPGHPFGFDAAGRDVFARVLYGTRTAISFGLLLSFSSLAIGIFFGAVQGFFVRWVDMAGQRLTEIWSAIPFLYVMIFLGNAFGRSFGLLLTVYAAFNWITVAAYVRAEFLRLRSRPFVDAGRVQGLSAARLMFRHVLPNATTPLVTIFPFLLVGAIGSLAALDYLGFGLPDGAPSWGELLQQAQSFRHAWWLVLWPSLALFATMLLGVFVGEALRDAFDPKPALGLERDDRRGTRRSSRGEPSGVDATGRAAALEIEDLRVAFDTPAGELEAVGGVSLSVAPGEAVGLVGESGCGKSVTAMSVLRLVPSPPGRLVSGAIRVAGRDVSRMPLSELRALRGSAVGMVFQDPMTALSPLRRVGDQMLEALRLHRKVSRREGLALAAKWLARCGIPDPERCLGEYPFRLSGGMQQRVMIASVLMTGPALVVADEPTTALDATVQAQVLDLLGGVRDARTALLLITHDMSVVKRVCSRVAVMYAGKIVESGPVGEVFASPRHPYTAALLDAMPSRHAPGERLPAIPGSVPSPLDFPRGCRFAPRCPRAVPACAASDPAPVPEGARSCACFRPLAPAAAIPAPAETPVSGRPRPAGAAAPALSVRSLVKRFPRVEAVSGVSFDVERGETLAVVGSSGCGKTTLLRMLAGLEAPTSGDVLLGGTAAGLRRDRRARRAVQMVFQDPFSALNPRMRVRDAVCEGAVFHGLVPRGGRDAFARLWLGRVGLGPEAASRFPHELSGGQLQRVSVARALSLEPDVLLLDEPVSALDVSVQAQILNLLADVKRDFAPAMVLVTHDLGVVRSVADRVLVMDAGRVVEEGPVAAIFSSPSHPCTRALLAAEGRV